VTSLREEDVRATLTPTQTKESELGDCIAFYIYSGVILGVTYS